MNRVNLVYLLPSFMTYHPISSDFNMNNTTGAVIGPGTAYFSEAPILLLF